MSTHNIGFYEEISRIIFNYHQISSNTHLICSSDMRSKEFDSFYPRHLCRGVYSYHLSVHPFVCSFVRLFVRSFVLPFIAWNFFFASKFCVKVSQVVYISATTYQKAFIF